MIKKSVVSLKFKTKLAEDALLTFSRSVHTKLTGNPLFTTIPAADLNALKDANTAYSELLDKAVGGSPLDTANKDKAKVVVVDLLNNLAQAVNIIANGNDATILSGGFELRKHPVRTQGNPDPVGDLVVQPTLIPGELACKWTKAALANKTAFEWAEEVEAPLAWHNGDYSDGSKLLMTGLPSKKNLLVRARSLATGNRKSAWCEPIRVFVY